MTQESLFSDLEPKTEYDQKHREAKLAFEATMGDMPYGDRYAALLGEGWGWRKAAYIAWESLPKGKRDPKTKGELADELGVSRSMFAVWKAKNPTILNRIARFSAANLLAHAADVDQAMLDSASDPSYKGVQDRRLFYERTKLIASRHKVDLTLGESKGDAIEDMSDAELIELAQQLELEDGEQGGEA